MPKPTQREAIIAALKEHGWTEDVNHRSLRYVVFINKLRPAFPPFYVGKAGALRVGRTVSESRPSRHRAKLLAEGRALLANQRG